MNYGMVPLYLYIHFLVKKHTSNPYFQKEMSCFISSKKCVLKFVNNSAF